VLPVSKEQVRNLLATILCLGESARDGGKVAVGPHATKADAATVKLSGGRLPSADIRGQKVSLQTTLILSAASAAMGLSIARILFRVIMKASSFVVLG
jgi:hypothetical protein